MDLAVYAGVSDALPLLARLTDWGEKNLGRARVNPSDEDSQGGIHNGQTEWYILPEHYYRAYLFTGDARYRDFADVWRYPHYWGFFNGQTPGTPDGLHAYSHCNALNGAAMSYAVTGADDDRKTFTGGAGLFSAHAVLRDGRLRAGRETHGPGRVAGAVHRGRPSRTNDLSRARRDARSRRPAAPGRCSSWCARCQRFTGAARYGDWAERVLYNGLGAALPPRGRGESFYYADYRLLGARKAYFNAAYPCCAGTYFQDIAGLHDVLYYTHPTGVCVNLYVPSEATWTQDDQSVTLTQRTIYPEGETVSFTLALREPQRFSVHLRIPEWAAGAAVSINGQPADLPAVPGTWLELRRRWVAADRFELRLPLAARAVPIDEQHPKRVAYARGPVVLVRPDGAAKADFGDRPTEGMVPFSAVGQDQRYAMYFDV